MSAHRFSFARYRAVLVKEFIQMLRDRLGPAGTDEEAGSS